MQPMQPIKHSEKPDVNAIINEAVAAGNEIAIFYRDRIAEALEADDLLRAEQLVSEYEAIYAANLTNANLAGWAGGFGDVADILASGLVGGVEVAAAIAIASGSGGAEPPGDRVSFPSFPDEPGLRFPVIENAVNDLISREIMTRPQYDQASQTARDQAFTVAYQDKIETISQIRQALVETVEAPSLGEFRMKIKERLETSPMGPGHLELVYRTNIQTAYSRGYDELSENPVVADAFPYQEYLPIGDSRVRTTHWMLGQLGLNGTGIYRRDDPMWKFFNPPWGYNCRCGKNLLTTRQAARKGVSEAMKWQETGEPPEQPEWRLAVITAAGIEPNHKFSRGA